MKHLIHILSLLAAAPFLRAEAVVTNVRAAQIPGTHQVRIEYDLAALVPCDIKVQVSLNGGVTYSESLSDDFFPEAMIKNVTPGNRLAGTQKFMELDANPNDPNAPKVTALQNTFTKNLRFKVLATENTSPPAPEGFERIEAGWFTMGRTSGDTDDNAPPVNVYVSEFYMAKYEVTKALWDEVRAWGAAADRGYTDLRVGGGKGPQHPVHTVSWWDVVKWCNARSEMEGFVPVYRNTNGTVFKTGTTVPTPNWSANGYRLPTEAEWEKAARGGVSGKRYPWGTDSISHAEANYYASGTSYGNQSGNVGYHPTYATGSMPYTSPVGSFAWNGYGLFNMSGNMREWCWDRYSASTYVNGATDPKGAASGSYRVIRGGSWRHSAINCRAAYRVGNYPTDTGYGIGFRVARSSVP